MPPAPPAPGLRAPVPEAAPRSLRVEFPQVITAPPLGERGSRAALGPPRAVHRSAAQTLDARAPGGRLAPPGGRALHVPLACSPLPSYPRGGSPNGRGGHLWRFRSRFSGSGNRSPAAPGAASLEALTGSRHVSQGTKRMEANRDKVSPPPCGRPPVGGHKVVVCPWGKTTLFQNHRDRYTYACPRRTISTYKKKMGQDLCGL
jgi:hypothetical protein